MLEPPDQSVQTKGHPQTRTKNLAPRPDTSLEEQTAPAASRAHTTSPDQSPPRKHPAATCVTQPPLDVAAQTAPPPCRPSTLAQTVRDGNIPPSDDHRSAPHTETPPTGSLHPP